MITCPTCERHIRIENKPCPFCGAAPSLTVIAAVLGLALAACGPAVDGGMTGSDDTTDGASTTAPGTTATPTTTGTPMTSSSTTIDPSTGSTGVDTGSSTANDDVDDTACGFYGCPGDLGPPMPIQCDVLAQDCPEDEKCMPWADDGGNAWTALRCSPVADAPAGLGETCRVEGSYMTGIDDCGDELVCFWVDPRSDVGTCVANCGGSSDAPTCSDPGTQCVIDFDDSLALCLPPCNPLAPDCAHGSCLRVDDGVGFACGVALQPSLADDSACDHDWSCAPGSVCLDGDLPPACEEGECCAPICDLDVPDACGPDRVCTSLQLGPDAPPEWHVGYCALP
jgi:hypothetical protein